MEDFGTIVRRYLAAKGREFTEEVKRKQARQSRMIRISPGQLRYPAAIRGWDQEAVAREAGVSAATVSRAMRGMPVRGMTALCFVQAFRRRPPLPD